MVVPASTTAVRIVAAAVRGMAETVLAPEDADHVEVVTAEVGNNIVTHGLGAGEACCHGESFLLSIMVNPQCVTMEFVDDGPPFDPVSALPGTPEESVARGGGGLGLYIMRRIMDELSYRRVGGSNVFRLVKRGTARVSEEDAQ
ncbi:ATP-binding protein [Candidatus Fermentibacteria bacterium]|nr:ATP-binding protein [Candidatus Fermentibacteria bacterium]